MRIVPAFLLAVSFLAVSFLAVSFLACSLPRPAATAEAPPPPPRAAAPTSSLSESGLEIRELRPGVWLHVSRHTYPSGSRFPSNGLAVADGDGLLLIDTAWGELATVELLERLERATGRAVTRAVATHFHYDRVAGADVLAARGIEVAAHPRTLALASGLGIPTPRRGLEALAEAGGSVRVGPVEVLYPGPGHAEDNLVVWLPEQKVLFGGCAVRAAAAGSPGNTADADLGTWPEAIRRVRARYPEAEVVVPGHGDPGGPELLGHTLELLAAAAPGPGE